MATPPHPPYRSSKLLLFILVMAVGTPFFRALFGGKEGNNHLFFLGPRGPTSAGGGGGGARRGGGGGRGGALGWVGFAVRWGSPAGPPDTTRKETAGKGPRWVFTKCPQKKERTNQETRRGERQGGHNRRAGHGPQEAKEAPGGSPPAQPGPPPRRADHTQRGGRGRGGLGGAGGTPIAPAMRYTPFSQMAIAMNSSLMLRSSLTAASAGSFGVQKGTPARTLSPAALNI